MRNLLNPKWLFIVNTLPIIAFFILMAGDYTVIRSLLDEDNIGLWRSFALMLGILGGLNVAYAIYLLKSKRNVSVGYAVIALVLHIIFIYTCLYYWEDMIPFTIPRWMTSDGMLYVGTFLMPTLIYCIFVLVVRLTPAGTGKRQAIISFGSVILIPIICYVFFQAIVPLWDFYGNNFEHVGLVFIIAATLAFIFFLIRGVYILVVNKGKIKSKYQLLWKIPIALILPLVGLCVNNGILFVKGIRDVNIFGDFTSPWFYILAVLNGILICLPYLPRKGYRLFLFIGRSILFAYTFYFFLVFLPFTPLSIIAILFVGVGFLMLTPLLLFVLHVQELSADLRYLKAYYSKNTLRIFLLAGFSVIPLCITGVYLRDRSVLHEALAYVYTPDYSKTYRIDKASLEKTLNVVKEHKKSSFDGLFNSRIPYLSTYFNRIVLDNLTLSNAKTAEIEKIFFGKTLIEAPFISENIRNKDVSITHISSSSRYDTTRHAWISRIDMEITNASDRGMNEYVTAINLPEGCFISDYYLDVEGKREPGILAEKRSAMWIYSQIRNENRDPGILYYLTGNNVAFRVFPFAANEVRKTGIEFLHADPVKLTIDANELDLGKYTVPQTGFYEDDHLLYMTEEYKQRLNMVERMPYFHFLIDASRNKEKNVEDLIERIERSSKNNTKLAKNARISFVNTYTETASLNDSWKDLYKRRSFEGGFYLDRAIRSVLVHSFTEKNDSLYPVIVAVTDDWEDAVLNKDFSDLKMTFPEMDLFFTLDDSGELRPHSLMSNPTSEISDTLYCLNETTIPRFENEQGVSPSVPSIIRQIRNSSEYFFRRPVVKYESKDGFVSYLPDSGTSIVLKKDDYAPSESDIREKDWLSGLMMQGMWISRQLHPELSGKDWTTPVKFSFKSKIMTPLTSYLVVENEAQKAVLKKKQEQVLVGNKSLDIDDEVQRMSEPGLIVTAILFGIVLLLTAKRRRKLS